MFFFVGIGFYVIYGCVFELFGDLVDGYWYIFFVVFYEILLMKLVILNIENGI